MTFSTLKHLSLGLGLLIGCNALYSAANNLNQEQFNINYLVQASNRFVMFAESGSTTEIINQIINIENDTANLINETAILHGQIIRPMIPLAAQERISQLNSLKPAQYFAGGLGLLSQKLLTKVSEHPKKMGAIMTAGLAYTSFEEQNNRPYLWAPENVWQEQFYEYRKRKALRALAIGSGISVLASSAYSFLFE